MERYTRYKVKHQIKREKSGTKIYNIHRQIYHTYIYKPDIEKYKRYRRTYQILGYSILIEIYTRNSNIHQT